MRITARQTQTRTLTDLYRAIDHQHAVTITYRDDKGVETIRTIEAYEIRTTKAGRIQVRAMCRLRGDARSFYTDQITAYTVHRIGFTLDRPEATSPAGRGIVARSEQQLIARDYHPAARSLTRQQTDLAA
ncbi:WYL domain-containing protein [Streptomyces alfalfae]|uniref:WYL domain-containing protein n=1 Tax=Streptomyces alfalfae TaxID=1642299 RepID=UPI0028115918|nr:WYL domain-containing protein [Streptomyces alfalfae]